MSDRIDTTVAFTGFGDALLTNRIAARANDSIPDPIVSTTATELTKTIPS